MTLTASSPSPCDSPPWLFPFSPTDWEHTPPAVQTYLRSLHQRLDQLQQQIAQLQGRLDKTSQTSSQPPASDAPFKKRPRHPASGKRGGQPVHHKQQRVLRTALSLWDDGHWEMRSWPLAPADEAPSWSAFVGPLSTKGITEQTTQLVVSDGAKGLDKALYSHLYGVPHQRCLFPKSKNITDHLQYAALRAATGPTASAMRRQANQERQRPILAEARHIYATDVAVEMRARVQAFRY